jgi:hypothetical protein
MTANWEECGPCPVFARFTLAFALQLRKKHGKASVRVRKTSVRLRKLQSTVYILPKHTHTLQNPHKHTHYKTHTHSHTHIHTHTHTHTHTLQNNIKPPQYKLKLTQCKIYPNE